VRGNGGLSTEVPLPPVNEFVEQPEYKNKSASGSHRISIVMGSLHGSEFNMKGNKQSAVESAEVALRQSGIFSGGGIGR